MEIDIVKTDAAYLSSLKDHIRRGVKTRLVIDIEALLMKGLADAIAAEHRRSNVMDGDLSDCSLIATVDLEIRHGRQNMALKPAKKRELSSLRAEPGDELASKAGKDPIK